MKTLTSRELRSLFIRFFKERGHAVIAGASLIPENDPTVLFTTAGMHPLVPYLLGEKHPSGKRLVNCQKCIRTADIDDVGDSSHCTFFEMLGNWSLGDYFKKEAISWSWEFLTSPEWLGIDKNKLAFTVFEGDENAPRDQESADLWREMGVSDEQIFFLPAEDNWWGPAGQTGPCGPDTEMFMITDAPACGENCRPGCKCGHYIEIWNNVFMQFNKRGDGTFEPLSQMNVDTGMGLERMICTLNGHATVYETDLFSGIIAKIAELSEKKYDDDEETTRAFRVIADHIRTATFILGDPGGVTPTNVDQGYVLRRLIRRAVRMGIKLGIKSGFTAEIADVIIEQYSDVYPELAQRGEFIREQLLMEENRFERTVRQGIREFQNVLNNLKRVESFFREFDEALAPSDKLDMMRSLEGRIGGWMRRLPDSQQAQDDVREALAALSTLKRLREKNAPRLKNVNMIDGVTAFRLYDTYGFPIEMTIEMAKDIGLEVDVEGFEKRFAEHQKLSHAGAEQRFKGGLADSSEETAHLHTATHLLHTALRQVLGNEVEQRGSNITAERLRFDFSFGRKVTKEELKRVEEIVNSAIEQDMPIVCTEMSVDEARAQNAIGLFESKYGELVKVYSIGDFSKEICGGPHAKNTGELGGFKIKKEESSSAGVRRIKAVLG